VSRHRGRQEETSPPGLLVPAPRCEVQFSHAGNMANSDMETADAKNRAMKEAGFIVSGTFEELAQVLAKF